MPSKTDDNPEHIHLLTKEKLTQMFGAAGCTKEGMLKLLGQSRFVTGNQRDNLYQGALKLGLDAERICDETELSGMMEGLYIKVEENGQVADRMKFVRAAFLRCVDFSETHWIDRPIVPNQLAMPLERIFER